MGTTPGIFTVHQPTQRHFNWGDVVVLVGIAALLYAGIRLATGTPQEIQGPTISLSVRALPYYAALSIGRMAAAYALSMLFSLTYGRTAAYNRRAEQVLLPVLDILQSIPILSFLPVVLLSLSAVLPQRAAAELASIILIFTSQAWNLTFAWYQSLRTIPTELNEASTIFRFGGWLRFRTVELSFGTISLIWNSVMSWSGGWFFLMAAEIFSVGKRDFRLPGLGAYLQEAANRNNGQAIFWGIATLVLVIVLLDQLIWRPLLAWSDKFKLATVASDDPPTSWFYDALRDSRLAQRVTANVLKPVFSRVDSALIRRFPVRDQGALAEGRLSWRAYGLAGVGGAALAYGAYRAALILIKIDPAQWADIGLGLGATMLRVLAALVITLAWTIPVGVAIGTNRRVATFLQPVVQIAASIPATALFPVFLLIVLPLPQGMNIAAVLLMLAGTQWYLLFNLIAGASAIPQDLKYTATLLGLNRWRRWRTLILPALFPYIITGAITASGGAWNASIVAERFDFGGQARQTTGIGALIAQATQKGDYALLLASTLAMILTVVTINRLVWRRFYRLAEEQYRLE